MLVQILAGRHEAVVVVVGRAGNLVLGHHGGVLARGGHQVGKAIHGTILGHFGIALLIHYINILTAVDEQRGVALFEGRWHRSVGADGFQLFTDGDRSNTVAVRMSVHHIVHGLLRHLHQVAAAVQLLLPEGDGLDVVHRRVELYQVEAAGVDRVNVVDGVVHRGVGRSGVGGADVFDGRIVEPQLVGALHRHQLARGVAEFALVAVVQYVDTAQHITALGRSAAADYAVGDAEHRQHALGLRGVVAQAVDADAVLAAGEAFHREVFRADIGTPVGAAVDRSHKHQLVGRQGRFQTRIGVGGAANGRGPHGAVLHGLDTQVHIGRAVDLTAVAAAEDMARDVAARDVHYRRGTQGGGVGIHALFAVAVIHVLRAAIDRLVHDAVFHVQHLHAVDQLLFVTGTAGIHVAADVAAVHVHLHNRVVVDVGIARRAAGIGLLAAVAVEGIVAVAATQVAEGGAHLAAAVDVVLHMAVDEVHLGKLVVRHIELFGRGAVIVVCIVLYVEVAVIVAVAAAVDVGVAARVDGDDALVDAAREVVAAVDVGGVAGAFLQLAVHGDVRGARHIGTPAATVDGVEGLLPVRIDIDIGVPHVAAAAAAIGFHFAQARADRRGVVEVHIAHRVHIAAARQAEVVPQTLAAAEDGAVDGGTVPVVAADGVVHHHLGRVAVAKTAAAIDVICDGAAEDVHQRAAHLGRARSTGGHQVVGVVGMA